MGEPKSRKAKLYSLTAAAEGTYTATVEANSLTEALEKSAQASWRLCDEPEVGEVYSVDLPDGTVLEGADIDDALAKETGRG